jgi:outer membrane protein assembly factor BamB
MNTNKRIIRAAAILPVAALAATAAAQQPTTPTRGNEWYAFRYNSHRTGVQPFASNLSDPAKVGSLAVKWTFPATGPGAGTFKASPIIVNDTVFIGSMSGRFYALDAATGQLKWEYPKPSDPPLLTNSGQWSYGIQSSAIYWDRPPDGAVIFGAQDPALGTFGSARLFALNAKTGALIWKSDRIAEINGNTPGSLTEVHQRIGYSAPLILDNKIYIGIHNLYDNPIQVGRVVAVDLANGHVDPAFEFRAVGTSASPPGTRGGGVWNSPATDGSGVYFTTGNVRCDNTSCQATEPNPNHGLSMIRVDKDTGKIIWALQPVPFKLDKDPDWSAGVTVMSTTCGELIASVQKDGWSYAVNAGNGMPGAPNVRWQFPPTGFPFTQEPPIHSDSRYMHPGAAWNDVLVINTGGESLVHDGVVPGYTKLHALNACATTEKTRVRWIADIPHGSGNGYSLGSPTVTGGIVFIGTNLGHLMVLADPSIVPGTGSRCSNIDYATPATCTAAGFSLVPIPKVLADVAMPDGGDISGMRGEPALAKGRVFVATGKGHVYMLEP